MNPWYMAAALAPLGAGLYAWAAVYPGAQLFGCTVQHADRGSALALSFDDGPNPAVTPQLIDLLDQYRVRATFFLIGSHVRACPELAREIAVRGHGVGNHTDTHPSLLWMPRQRIINELSRCQDSIERATGSRPTLMRPPYGYRGPQLQAAVRQAGLKKVVMWSVAVSDWKAQPATRLIKRLRRARGGDIVVLHDGDPDMLGADRAIVPTALEFWLPRWRDEGVEFVALDTAEANRPASTAPVA